MRAINLENKVFGKLTAVRAIGSKDNRRIWLCKCECGNEKEVFASYLTCGETKSCGCLKYSEEANNKIREFRKGIKLTEDHKKRIGDTIRSSERYRNAMLSKERSEKISNALTGRKHTDEFKRKVGEKSKGRKPSLAARKKMSENRKGEKHHNWQGGITPINSAIRNSFEYKQWRKSVFERDNFTCQECGKRGGGELNADHIKPFAFFPELRLELSNGRTLCENCHRQTDTFGMKAVNTFKQL